MKDTIKYLVWIFAIVPFLIACGDSNTDDAPTDDFDVRFELPATVDVSKGGELTFTVKEGKSPLTTDSFLLEGGGISYLCPILRTSSESFTVRLADECESGSYTAYLKRDARKKSIGKIYINIVDKIDFEPSAGTTVFGLVSSEEGPVANVVVSDGTEVTVTDDKGIYELKSAKKWGYVFISVPSGYEVAAEGVFPQFYQTLKGAADVVEQKDFKLTKVDGQDRYKLFLLGDMHLANRTNDAAQFTQFTTDLNAYMAQHSGQKMYALTLGDMTWDLYWYKNNLCAAPVPGDDQPPGQEPANLPHHGQPRQRLHDHVRLRRGRQVRGLHRPDLLLVQHRSGALRRHGQYRLQRIRRNRLAQLRQEALQRTIEVARQGSGVRRQVDASDRGHACANIQAHEHGLRLRPRLGQHRGRCSRRWTATKSIS